MRLRRRSFGLFSLFAALPLRGHSAPSLSRDATLEALASAAFELFPHEAVPRSKYETLARSFVEADAERGFRFAIDLGGEDFLAASRPERIGRLESVQSRAEFFALRMHVLMGLYNDLEVTRGFGYQGPSYAQGGYLERGFDDLKWLPEPDRAD